MSTQLQDHIVTVLADPEASYWLKNALLSAMTRDPIDARNDAEVLASLLQQSAEQALRIGY